jgi:hypothetical protein
MSIMFTRTRLCRAALIALGMLAMGCNSRTPILDTDPVLTAPTSIIGPPPQLPLSTLVRLEMDPAGLIGGRTGRGRATLSFPAPQESVVIRLETTSAAVTIPRSLTVPAGADSAEFPFSTAQVSEDAQVTVVGSASGRSTTAMLSVWTASLPTFFSFNSDRGHLVGRGEIRRFTPETATLTASCAVSQVRIQVSGRTDRWDLTFGAPVGTPLRRGTYENAQDGGPAPSFPTTTGPVFQIGGNGSGCGGAPQFTVHEVELGSEGGVRKFWATFESRCGTRPEALRGDVRITNALPPPPTVSRRCIVD